MKNLNKIHRALILRYLYKQYAMQLLTFITLVFVLFFSFFEMEKRNLSVFTVEEGEEYCHIIECEDTEVSELENVSEKIGKFIYSVYGLNNKLIGKSKNFDSKHSLFLESAKNYEDKEIRISFLERPGKIMPYLVINTKLNLISGNKYLGYIIAGSEISHKFRGVLRLAFAFLIVFLIYAFVIYKMTLKLVVSSVMPINEALLAQRNFSANASHDLKTPISILIMSLECLKSDKNNKFSDFSAEILNDMENSVLSMKKLTESLMILAKSESGAEKLDMSIVDLCEVVSMIISAFSKIVKNRNIDLILKTDLKVAAVWVNKNHLEQIISNILENACKYSKNGGTVIIDIEKVGSKFILSIKDFGIGIAEKDIHHIFDRFYRVDKSRNTEGYGLGLAISYEFAAKNNIEITVESTLGEGSVFKLLVDEHT